jgi:ABC-2 type transport system ATP-binding protein
MLVADGPVIKVCGLVKEFARSRAVDGFDLRVQRGEVHGFLGPNGAGKSTTLRVLLGLYRRTAGTVSVLGLDPATHPAEVTRQVSYVPGEVTLWPGLSGQEVLDDSDAWPR